MQKIIIVLNDGIIDSDDDSHNEECWFGGGQNRASSTLRLCDRCEMQSGNRHEAEMTAEQLCERSNQITQDSENNPSHYRCLSNVNMTH